jgi:hypothetical protein
MMQKRTLYSLLLISFIVVFGWSFAMANDVTIQSKNASRCANGQLNVTANVTEDSVSAIEVVVVISKTAGCAFFDSVSVTWDPLFLQLPDRVIDYTKRNGTDPDTIRFAALRLNPGGGAALNAGSKVIAQLKFKTNDCCGGTVGIAGGEFTYPNPTSPIVTAFVNAATSAVVPAALVPGTVTVLNSTPVLATIGDTSIPWGAVYSKIAHATDLDTVGTGCEQITYTLLEGPGGLNPMVVNPTSGAIFWPTGSGDVCTHPVKIVATDKCGAADTMSYTICVTNVAPVATCPANRDGCLQTTVTAQVSATDPDGGPGGLLYSISSTTAPGGVSVHPTTGLVTFVIGSTADYTGTFEICVKVADGAPACSPCSPSNADTCCFTVNVRSMTVTIEKQHDVVWGQPTVIDVSMLPSAFKNFAIGGYDFLIQYDNSVLTFMNAAAGEFLTDCGWEYFTYRNGYSGNCGSGCPSGLIRIVGIAETNNGANHPLCFVNTGSISNVLAQLTFLVSNDRNLECLFVPIRFFWIDCGDNTLSDPGGDTLLMSNHVYDYIGSDGADTYYEVTDPGASLPGPFGAPSPLCDTYTQKGKPVRCANFYNGGVDIICADSIDSRGDINLNSIAYEIADAVMFTNYFIYGLSAFQGHVDGSMAASDVNGDGLTLTVADLVQLIRVVIGDALPLPKEVVVASVESVNANYTTENGIIGVDTDLGAALVVVKGNVTPELIGSAINSGLTYNYDATTEQTRILVHPTMTESSIGAVIGFSGDFLNLGDAGASVVSVEAATTTGAVVVFKLVPKSFGLAQNYPNPFNPSTTIQFDIPKAAAWTLTVYNVAGQVVETYTGVADHADSYSVTFDGANRASGLYLYRLTAGDFNSVKKMVMIK